MSTLHQSKMDEELARIRSIIDRYALPSFITGIDVRLGDLDGDGVLWVDLQLEDEPAWDSLDMKDRVASIIEFEKKLRNDLLAEIHDRYPYFQVRLVERGPAYR